MAMEVAAVEVGMALLYMQPYTTLLRRDTTRDARVEINSTTSSISSRRWTKIKSFVKKKKKKEKRKTKEIVYRAKMFDIEQGKGKVWKEEEVVVGLRT